MSKNLITRFSFVTAAAFLTLILSGAAFGQTLYDSFSDGDFTANPTWSGTNATWTVVANSDVSTGATGSNTLRLNAPAVAQTEYLSSQVTNWGTNQEWGFFIGRRLQAATSANQAYFWLYANEADLTSATVDGYRIAYGDDTGGDNLRLEYIVDGAVSATVITSTGSVTNGLTDYGFLVRVTRTSTGNWQIFTSPLPTASGTGNIATDVPNAANTTVSQGTGANTSLVPATGGFIGVAALHSTGANALTGVEFDQIYFTPTVTTAASISIGGRVTLDGKSGLSQVLITISGDISAPRTVRTNSFGYYNFSDLPVGTYIITANAKKYTFSEPTRVVSAQDSLADVDFTANQ